MSSKNFVQLDLMVALHMILDSVCNTVMTTSIWSDSDRASNTFIIPLELDESQLGNVLIRLIETFLGNGLT